MDLHGTNTFVRVAVIPRRYGYIFAVEIFPKTERLSGRNDSPDRAKCDKKHQGETNMNRSSLRTWKEMITEIDAMTMTLLMSNEDSERTPATML